jgi:hypothetical protein
MAALWKEEIITLYIINVMVIIIYD